MEGQLQILLVVAMGSRFKAEDGLLRLMLKLEFIARRLPDFLVERRLLSSRRFLFLSILTIVLKK